MEKEVAVKTILLGHAVLTYYPRGKWQKRRSKSGKRFGKFLGFERSQGLESLKFVLKPGKM